MEPKPTPTGTAPGATTSVEEATTSRPGTGTNVVALSGDPTLLEILKQALDGRQRVWRADDALHAADLLVAAPIGVMLVDAALTMHDTPGLIDKLHDQFPDLPIIVAGRRDDEIELGQRISNGVVFRFLHKPVSAERVRTFIDTAARRAGDRPAAEPRKSLSRRVIPTPMIRLPRLRLDPALLRRAARPAGVAIAAVLASWALMEVVERRPWEQVTLPSFPSPSASSPTVAPPPAQNDTARLLDAASIALTQGRLAEPEGQNAIELYRAVLIRDPGNPDARDGLVRTAEALLLRVEERMLAHDVAGAAGALDAARSADPSNPRLEFFSSQLMQERERREAATALTPRQGEMLAEQALTAEVNTLLTEADARMKAGRLAGGPDTAEALVLEARRLRADDPGVVQALNALSSRMVLAAREALASGDFGTTRDWLDRAEALGTDTAAVARVRAEMATARMASVQEDRSRLLALANQRIAQGRLLEPATDSARHYVDLLRAADPGHEGLAETEALLASGLLQQARKLLNDGRHAEAERFIAAADAAGARASDLSVARTQLANGRELQRAAGQVLPENVLTRTEHSPVRYPPRARDRRVEGWVDVEYTVAADGTTRDATVIDASPEGYFEQSTLDAISEWRYEPRIVADRPVDQRVRLRVRYQLSGG